MANQKRLTTEEILASMTDEQAQEEGYPDAEAWRMEHDLVSLGCSWKLKGGEDTLEAYHRVLDKLFEKGWSPYLLDGQQEIMIGMELMGEMYAKFKARNIQTSAVVKHKGK